MKVNDLYNYLDKTFPLKYQEEFDNSGAQIYFPEQKVDNVMISLDVCSEVITEALKKSCNVIITHHPLFFKPLNKIISGNAQSDIIIQLIENKISLISLHTNLDKIYYDKLSKFLGFEEGSILIEDSISEQGEAENIMGFGMICDVKNGIKLVNLIEMIKNYMDLKHIVYTGNLEKLVFRVVFLNGSGTGFLTRIINMRDIDCLVTGDLGYHGAHDARLASLSVIDAGHYNTEIVLLKFLIDNMQDFLTKKKLSQDIHIYLSEIQENPLKIY